MGVCGRAGRLRPLCLHGGGGLSRHTDAPFHVAWPHSVPDRTGRWESVPHVRGPLRRPSVSASPVSPAPHPALGAIPRETRDGWRSPGASPPGALSGLDRVSPGARQHSCLVRPRPVSVQLCCLTGCHWGGARPRAGLCGGVVGVWSAYTPGLNSSGSPGKERTQARRPQPTQRLPA